MKDDESQIADKAELINVGLLKFFHLRFWPDC